MDEKYFKVVDKMISQGKSSDYILQVLNMQQAGVSEGDLAAYMELKKKRFRVGRTRFNTWTFYWIQLGKRRFGIYSGVS